MSESGTNNLEELVADVGFSAVRAWKEAEPGRHVIGYFPVYAPVEIIHAAGMLPVALHGAGDRLDIQHADSRFGSFICSIAKTTMELGMTGRLDFLDGILFSTICDTARNLCFVMQRNFPSIWIDFLHLPQNPSSGSTVAFLTSEYRRLKEKLETLSGKPIEEDALHHSILLYNENRSLTRQLVDLRSATPQLISTAEMYALVRAGDLLPVEQHNELLRESIAAIPRRSGRRRDSIRVVIEGAFCEQPPMDLIRLIEAAGCYIVDDDFALGRRWFASDVPFHGDPLETLAASYVDRSVYSSVRHDFREPRFDGLVRKVRERRADAVISLIAKFCEPAYFDYVLFKRALEEKGIPHLAMEYEEKTFTFERLQTEVETFVESMLFA